MNSISSPGEERQGEREGQDVNVGETTEGVGVGDVEGDMISEKKYKMKLKTKMSSLNIALAFSACG